MLNEKIIAELKKIIVIANKNDGCIGESFIRDSILEVNTDHNLFMQIQEFLLENNVQIDHEDGVEDLDESSDSITIKPFDTSKIDISPKTYSLDIIISRLENDEIDMLPDFQRKAGLWSHEQKSQLIESLILRIPLPAFYFDGSDNRWIVIDGLQRLTTIKEFFVDRTLCLHGLEFLKELEGSNCDELPRSYIRRMKETSIITYIINPGAPINLKFNIFKRINTGGLKLEPQEIRHALFQGFSTLYLKELANLDSFKNATGYSIRTDRMLDREFVLRFIAFYELGVERYNGLIDEYLNEAMELLNKKYLQDRSAAENTKRKFELVLDVSYEIFGKFSFRRMPDEIRRRSISKALFEAWTSILARYSVDRLQQFIERKKEIKNAYMALFKDEEFVSSIGSGKPYAVKKMFDKIAELVREFI